MTQGCARNDRKPPCVPPFPKGEGRIIAHHFNHSHHSSKIDHIFLKIVPNRCLQHRHGVILCYIQSRVSDVKPLEVST